MKKKLLYLIVAVCTMGCLFTSCKKDVVLNSEAEIVSFTFNEKYEIIVGDATIDDATKKIAFTVSNSATDEQIKALIPTIEVSSGATISPASGAAVDFTETVKYIVKSEDQNAMTEYEVTGTREIGIIGTELDGVYKGDLDITLEEVEVGKDVPQKIYISKTGENLVKMELNNFSFSGIPLGNIAVENIAVTKIGTSNDLVGSQTIILNNVGECDVEVVGNITNGILEMEIDVKVKALNQNVLVDFKGNKLAVDQSSEAFITSFTFESLMDGGTVVVVEQPIIEGNEITFVVSDSATEAEIKALIPTIIISDKATISLISGVVADFNSPVIYTVTSEDGIYKTDYTVSIIGKIMSFSFDIWTEIPATDYTPAYSEVNPISILASSNLGAAFLGAYGFTGGVNVMPASFGTTRALEPKAAKIVTLDTRAIANSLVPGITSGALFMGKFDIAPALAGNRLECTRFGVDFNDKLPYALRGRYKYVSGEKFYDASNHLEIKEVEGKKDRGSIVAVMFEVENEDDVLTGVNIGTSDKIVAMALVGGINDMYQPNGIVDTPEYVDFEITFTYMPGKEYDASKKYKMTFVCSSSIEGDTFKGAPNSTLTVDNFEILYEVASESK